MKRLVCMSSTLTVLALLAGAGADETPTIKQLMQKLHKGAKAPLTTLKTALKAESPDWKAVQDQSKDVVILGAGLAKGEPPRGEKTSFVKLANAYYENAKDLDDAAKKQDKAEAQAALSKLGASCKSCHAAHKGQ
jgi:hypothetical protein